MGFKPIASAMPLKINLLLIMVQRHGGNGVMCILAWWCIVFLYCWLETALSFFGHITSVPIQRMVQMNTSEKKYSLTGEDNKN